MRDYTGKVFGFLTVIDVNVEKSKQASRGVWNCLCICGNIVVKSSSDLGRCVPASSCGCYKKPKKVRSENHTVVRPYKKDISSYKSWEAMRQRCNNPNHKHFNYYGGRGITVCDRWVSSFENFLNDMGERPSGMTLDRIDATGNYEPSNCRWATKEEQSRNRAIVKKFQVFGELLTMPEIAERLGVSYGYVYNKLQINKVEVDKFLRAVLNP